MAEEQSFKAKRAQRIQALSAIEEDVASLLRAAGNSISALSSNPPSESNSTDPTEARKAAFTTNATAYFKLFSRIQSALQTESEALQDEGLIPAKAADARPVVIEKGDPSTNKADDVITAGGLGNLDIGWLNSRGDEVGRRKEEEVWKEAREMLEGIKERKGNTHNGDVEMDNADIEDGI
ncbi:hypothetical protein NA57DRAFT_58724 [Rhizodiscina lignyota]|uniref:Mediator of RNA polymerase II transcription subunit 11 n=1 Tax=Rhizodiscina lignyota TaxID=1504668 RepID=A0A9P4M4F6_9PEZI|nr:hypothetical protein NA57DRAFT_58724 [Rhizodiscina lignyota]